jgi:hypothetical protein
MRERVRESEGVRGIGLAEIGGDYFEEGCGGVKGGDGIVAACGGRRELGVGLRWRVGGGRNRYCIRRRDDGRG